MTSELTPFVRRPTRVLAVRMTEEHADGFLVSRASVGRRAVEVIAETRAGADRAVARLRGARAVAVRPFVYLGARRGYFQAGDWLVVWPNGARSVYSDEAFLRDFEERSDEQE